MYGYIYKTTNIINGKIYIGQKKSDIFVPTYIGSGKLLRKAIIKYGKENFKVEVICWCETKEELNISERNLIHSFNSQDRNVGYNLAEGGEGSNGGGFKGKRHSEETKKKISNSVKKENEKRSLNGWKPFLTSPRNKKGATAINKGMIRIFKNNTYKFIPREFLDKFLSSGWIINNKIKPNLSYLNKPDYKLQLKTRFIDKKWINNGEISKRISKELIDEYLLNGWFLGRLSK